MAWRVALIALLLVGLGAVGLWWLLGRPPLELGPKTQSAPPEIGEVRELARGVEGVGVRETEEGTVLEFSDLLFDFDRATIRPDAEPVLVKLAAFLDAHPAWRLRLEGHTDSVGTPNYNQGLSEARARAVADFLEARGVGAGRMTLRGLGESHPVAPNDTREGRQRNRRVEVTLLQPRGAD